MGMTLKSARVNKDFTQEQAAKLIGVTADTLRRYEKGLSFPDVPIIKKIEEVYEQSYSDIIFLPQNNGKTVN